MYHKILNEAIEELKETDFKELFQQELESNQSYVRDCVIETDLEVLLPDDYVTSVSERLLLYKELNDLTTEEELDRYRSRLIDRFGPLPEEAEELMNVVRIRWVCCQLGIEKIHLKGERIALYLQSKNPAYLHSDALHRIVDYVRMHLDRCQFHEVVDRKGKSTGKKYITITNVRTLQGALNLLNKICNLSE